MSDFTPVNSLERALVKAQAGELPVKAFLALLLTEDLAIPSKTEVQADGSNLAPLLYDRQGVSRVAVFTDASRTVATQQVAKYLLVTNGFYLLKRIPPQFGLAVNPGFSVGLDLPPAGLQQMLRDFTNTPTPPQSQVEAR